VSHELGVSPRQLAPGVTLRMATTDDVQAIVALSVAEHGAFEADGVRWTMEDPDVGPAAWTVVVDDRGEVLSTCGLLRFPLEVRSGATPGGPEVSVAIQGGQIEYVATRPEHRNRGLVRAQVDHHHRRSAARGDLLQVIAGIPYFYRRLGYGYGASMPAWFEIDPAWPPPGGPDAPDDIELADIELADIELDDIELDDIEVSAAEPADRTAMAELQRRRQCSAEVVRTWSDHDWAAMVSGGHRWGDNVLVARAGGAGRVEGWARVAVYPGDQVAVVDAATGGTAAAVALLAETTRRHSSARRSGRYLVADQPADPWGAVLRSVGQPLDEFGALYVRVPDPQRLLAALVPVLDARLAASPWAHHRGEVVLSLYHHSLRLVFDTGRVVSVEPGPLSQDPSDDGNVGIAPDWFGAMTLGRFGASELERRVDDVILGRHRALMDVLFPHCRSDLLGPL
jgi:ribosomal protein S18 acetylase RimI-like enzyme